MRTPEEIAYLWQERQGFWGPVLRTARIVAEYYNADVALPVTEMYGADEQASVANLLQMGLDGTAQRIASTMPDVEYPSVRPGFKEHDDRAAKRRKANLGWWEMNEMPVRMGRRARHLVGYASSPVVLRPDRKRGIPIWQVRDPLGCFPAPTAELDEVTPPDCIFAFTRSLRWLLTHYPEHTGMLDVGRKPNHDDLFDLVEYIDDDQHLLMAIGRNGVDHGTNLSGTGWHAGNWNSKALPGWNAGRQVVGMVDGAGGYGAHQFVVLHDVPNRAGVCTAVVPGRVTLDRPMGQFDGMLGLFQTQARLAALELIAIERGIFPEDWLIGRQNETPSIVQVADGRQGIPGIVTGGDMRQNQQNPGYKTGEAIDRLERAQRLEGAVPAEFGGESNSNIRTGRRGDQILAAQVDYGIQEAQRMLAASLREENVRAVAVAKGYFGSRPVSFYVSWSGAKGQVDYKANDIFDTDRNSVRYAMVGVDANGLTIRLAQKVGTGLMSKTTARKKDPDIEDPELEHDLTIAEGIEAAVMAAFQTQANAGEVPIADAARVQELVVTNRQELFEAIQTAQREAQERQAAQVQPADPAAQPGLAMPGMGAEAPTAIPEGEPSMDNLANMLSDLRRPAQQLPSERVA